MDLGIISIIFSIVGAALVLVGLFISFHLESEVGIIFVISGFIALLVALLMSSLTTSTEEYNICSVKTQSEYSSCFFLGTGGMEKDDYYYFYRINEKGGKSIDRVPMQWATVYDTLTESETPHIIIKKRGGSIDSAELYVPKGTVIDTYDISYPE